MKYLPLPPGFSNICRNNQKSSILNTHDVSIQMVYLWNCSNPGQSYHTSKSIWSNASQVLPPSYKLICWIEYNQSINRSINMVIRWWFALFGNVEYWERGSQLVTLWWFYSNCHHHVITTQKHLKQLWCFQA